MKISPPALIITVGTVMIISAFALFGKKKTTDTAAPVPFIPDGAASGTIGYTYRGLFVGITPAGSVPVEGFNSSWQWKVYGTDDFSVAPLSTGQSESETGALNGAMIWIDGFKG